MTGFPALVKIDMVSGGVVQFGPSAFISPKNAVKSIQGSGSFNTAFQITNINGVSSTNTIDSNLVDQPIVGNE